MKILFIGDVVGSPGRLAITKLVPGLKKELGLSFVIANAENIAGGSGITPTTVKELFDAGVNVLTSGDHIWKKAGTQELVNSDSRIIRPANYPSGAPGAGWNLFNVNNFKVGVVNINGRVFMDPIECPFKTALAAYEDLSKQTKIIIVDIHAEATSEKSSSWVVFRR